MKKKCFIVALLINLIIITVLQINMIDDITVGANIKDKYEEILNYTYNYNSYVASDKDNSRKSEEAENIEAQNEKANEDKNTENKSDFINTGDNIPVGIVITKSDSNIYHNNLTIKSKGQINLYYGKNYKNKKTFPNGISISLTDNYFDNKNIIKIKSKNKLVISGISEVGLDGSLYIYKEKEGMVVVNNVNVEKYLCGVVASEMPESFEMEALKAQAVCARTYTYAHLENDKYEKYNAIMDDTVSYQAYGESSGSEKIREAVAETKGVVLSEKNQLINAYYFSTSCGYTTDYKIWGDESMSYLKSKYVSVNEGVADVSTGDFFNKFIKNTAATYESACPFFRWNVTINTTTIKNKVYDVTGKNIGDIKSVTVKKRGDGGIASKIVVEGEDGNCILEQQYEIRQVFSPYGYHLNLNDGNVRTDLLLLPSAFITIDQISSTKYKITGGGFGHGSGMSQYGANEMAKQGMKYEEILHFFYSDVNCGNIDIR